jgi:hypothetical protein
MTNQLNNQAILIHRRRKIGWGSDVSISEDSIGGVDFDMPSSFHDGLGLIAQSNCSKSTRISRCSKWFDNNFTIVFSHLKKRPSLRKSGGFEILPCAQHTPPLPGPRHAAIDHSHAYDHGRVYFRQCFSPIDLTCKYRLSVIRK